MVGPQRRRSLEAIDGVGSVRMKHRSFRQLHEPKAFCEVTPANLLVTAWAICNQVAVLENHHGEPSHVFVSPALQVFVMLDSRIVATRWLREHFDWYLGLYRRRTQFTQAGMPTTLELTPEGVAEDLQYHLRDLGLA